MLRAECETGLVSHAGYNKTLQKQEGQAQTHRHTHHTQTQTQTQTRTDTGTGTGTGTRVTHTRDTCTALTSCIHYEARARA